MLLNRLLLVFSLRRSVGRASSWRFSGPLAARRILCVLAAAASLAVMTPAAATEGANELSSKRLAQKRFEAARLLYDGGDYVRALEGFRASYAAYPSPNSLLYVARSLSHIGHQADAAWAYEQAAREASAAGEGYEQALRAAREEARALERSIARIRLRIVRPRENMHVEVGSRRISSAELARWIPVVPGDVRIRVDAAGIALIERHLTIDFGARQELVIELPPRDAAKPAARSRAVQPAVSDSGRPERRDDGARPRWSARRTFGWIALGAGAASLISAIVTWRLAQDRFDTLEEACGAPPCGEGDDRLIDEGRRLETATNTTLGLGIGLSVIGASLLVWDLLRGSPGKTTLGLGADGAARLTVHWL